MKDSDILSLSYQSFTGNVQTKMRISVALFDGRGQETAMGTLLTSWTNPTLHKGIEFILVNVLM